MGRPKGSKNKPKVQDGTPISNKTVNTAASTSTPKSNTAPKTTKTVNTKSTTTRNQTKKLDKVDKLLLNKSATVPTIDTPKGKKTVAEMSTTLTKHERVLEMAKTTKAMIDALQLTDLSKTESRTFQTYSRETLRTYMKSPKSYESQLRNLSRYLYRLCYEYRRICKHYATMICGDAFNIIPLDDPTQEMTPEERTNTWYETMIRWQRMDFASELVKLLLVAWREDSVYAYVYDDSDQEGGTCFYQILDGDYCRVSSVESGVFRFAFDFSYFRSHETYLDYWDSEFKSKYEAYQKDSTLRWQELEPERQVCFKVNSDDPTMDYPSFSALFQTIINAIDLQEIQAVKDELSAYKLLVARLKPLSGTSDPDDFEIDPDTALKYYNKLAANVPPCVNVVLSPMEIDTIEFKDLNNTDDTDMISNSISNIFKHIGGVILDSDKSGTTIYEAQIIADMKYGQSTLLPQVQRYLNLYFNYVVGTGHGYFKYIDGVCPYTRRQKRKELIESAQNGLPRMSVGVLDGNTLLEQMSMLKLERDLGLVDLMSNPLSTSYTQSGSQPTADTDQINGGAPSKDSDDLTDSGSKSKERGNE